jgi:hypothetical protein
MSRLLAFAWAAAALPAVAAERPLPLPLAPVRLLVPDAAAFDRALTGRFRLALEGEAPADDPVVTAWRRTQVGTKLEDQWTRLSADLPWTWAQIRRLQPRRVGLALLDVAQLEAVLAIETPLAALPVEPPLGEQKQHAGIAYRLVARGAADGAEDERRMGLAWARVEDRLLLATSERALVLALDASIQAAGFEPSLTGLVSVELDVDALRKDLYFRREFLFGATGESGVVRAALRLEDGRLVEVREGQSAEAASARRFDAAGLGAGWEPEAEGLLRALRAGVLEPVTSLAERPVAPVEPLPLAKPDTEDRYLVDLRRPLSGSGPQNEEGELPYWRALLAARPAAGWAFAADASGRLRVGFEWPAARDPELVALLRRTVERRAGRVAVANAGGATELRVGPDLAAAALRRTGSFVWIAADAASLAGAIEPVPASGVVRWARLDLRALRGESARWPRLEGPASPEEVRPFSDRLLGLLGWIPEVQALSVERRRDGERFQERLVFE